MRNSLSPQNFSVLAHESTCVFTAGGGKHSPLPFWVLSAGLIIKQAGDRLTSENNQINYMHMYGNPTYSRDPTYMRGSETENEVYLTF